MKGMMVGPPSVSWMTFVHTARDYGCQNDTDRSLLETMTIFEGNNTVVDCLAYNRAMEGNAGRWSGLKNGFVLQFTAIHNL